MTAPVSSNPSSTKSRRALLAGALGGIGAWAASAVGRASPVRAEGEAMVVGGDYLSATSSTQLVNQANHENVFTAQSLGGGIGLLGSSSSNFGVFANSGSGIGLAAISTAIDKPASRGWSHGNSTGVLGYSGADPAAAARPKTGVYGHATQDSESRGVWGRSNAGVGVYAVATTGYALRTDGRTMLSTSGVATINAGSASKTITPGVNVTAGSFVLLTPKANIGSRALWFTTNATADTFTIRMSSSRSSNTRVAWLLLG